MPNGQLWTICGLYRNQQAIPLIYSLMPRKKTEDYETIIQELDVLEPTKIICDFELPVINAIKASLGGARVSLNIIIFIRCIIYRFKDVISIFWIVFGENFLDFIGIQLWMNNCKHD
jgi:hypothetical protein